MRRACPLFVCAALFLTAGADVVWAGSATWNVNAAGSWIATANWNPNTTFPNAVDDVASITNNITAARIISLNQAGLTIGTLNLGDGVTGFFGFTLATGTAGSLVFDVSAGNAGITKTVADTATDMIAAPILLNDALDINLQTASGGITISGSISDDGGSRAINKLGGGTGILTLSGANRSRIW